MAYGWSVPVTIRKTGNSCAVIYAFAAVCSRYYFFKFNFLFFYQPQLQPDEDSREGSTPHRLLVDSVFRQQALNDSGGRATKLKLRRAQFKSNVETNNTWRTRGDGCK